MGTGGSLAVPLTLSPPSESLYRLNFFWKETNSGCLRLCMVIFDFFLQPFKNTSTVLNAHRLNKSRAGGGFGLRAVVCNPRTGEEGVRGFGIRQAWARSGDLSKSHPPVCLCPTSQNRCQP